MKTRLEMILLLVLMTRVTELLAQEGSTAGPGDQVPAQPLLSAPRLGISRSGANTRLTASDVESGKQFVLQWSTNLIDWIEIRSVRPTGSTYNWTETRQGAVGFYGLIRNPDPPHLVAAAIYQAMTSSDVQGLSVAVMTNGSIAWAKGFGRLAKGRPELVGTNTLFQAAVITKPATALAALKMVDHGLLSLDEPVNNKLKTLLIPGKNATNVTLRRILSHTAGVNLVPIPGYVVGSKLPTLVQILKGEPPASTPPVMASGPVGVWDYSNGGYLFLQALLTDVSGQEFPDLLRSMVLDPLGMKRSTFEQPLPDKLQSNAASGHVGGAVIEGNWHVYPELAAAGLWTTASDLARMFIAIRSAYLAGPEPLIEQTTPQQMLMSQAIGAWGPWGLGLSLKLEQGRTVSFQHAGVVAGFRAGIIMILKTGDGLAIMTNSETSIENTIYNACATVYGWPQTLPDCCF